MQIALRFIRWVGHGVAVWVVVPDSHASNCRLCIGQISLLIYRWHSLQYFAGLPAFFTSVSPCFASLVVYWLLVWFLLKGSYLECITICTVMLLVVVRVILFRIPPTNSRVVPCVACMVPAIMSGLFASRIGRLMAISVGFGLSVIHASMRRCMGVIVKSARIVVLLMFRCSNVLMVRLKLGVWIVKG